MVLHHQVSVVVLTSTTASVVATGLFLVVAVVEAASVVVATLTTASVVAAGLFFLLVPALAEEASVAFIFSSRWWK